MTGKVSRLRWCFFSLLAMALSTLFCLFFFKAERCGIGQIFRKSWGEELSVVEIANGSNGATQSAYLYKSTSDEEQPLIVSLHTWSGDYAQYDELSEYAINADFNYIHPNFYGPNDSPLSCASQKALNSIDDAISYCIDNLLVDTDKIYVVGASGGGHAACAVYLSTKHAIRAYYVWVPITDIEAWYYQTRQRGMVYASNIENICGGSFDPVLARSRSPLFMDVEGQLHGKIHLFAGIDDGYSGSVPVSHSILFFNRLCEIAMQETQKVNYEEAIALLTKEVEKTEVLIGDRTVYFERFNQLSSVTVFDGGHEMLTNYTFECIERDIKNFDYLDN